MPMEVRPFDDTVESDPYPVFLVRVPENAITISLRSAEDLAKVATRELPDNGPLGEWMWTEVSGRVCEAPLSTLGMKAGCIYYLHVTAKQGSMLTVEFF